MRLEITPDGKKDLRDLEDDLQNQISQEIEDLKDNPLPDNSTNIYLPDGDEVQRLKLQEEDRNSDLNHRVIYDIVENRKVRIYGVWNREKGYQYIKNETSERK